MKQYIIDRLNESSTWRGIIMVLTACGLTIAPEKAEAIITVGLAIAGIIGAATRG